MYCFSSSCFVQLSRQVLQKAALTVPQSWAQRAAAFGHSTGRDSNVAGEVLLKLLADASLYAYLYSDDVSFICDFNKLPSQYL